MSMVTATPESYRAPRGAPSPSEIAKLALANLHHHMRTISAEIRELQEGSSIGDGAVRRLRQEFRDSLTHVERLLSFAADTRSLAQASPSAELDEGLTEIEDELAHLTNEELLLLLRNARWPNGFQCPSCASNTGRWNANRRAYRCSNCGKAASVTAGAVLTRCHLPARVWFHAFEIVATNPQITSSELACRLGLSRPQTAAAIKQKLSVLCASRKRNTVAEIAEALVAPCVVQ